MNSLSFEINRRDKMKKIVGVRTLKTGLGATIAMMLAQLIELKYTASAGIITILSIQSTKRESVQIAIRRLLATVVALGVGGILFSLLGFKPIVFGVYLIVFIPIAARFKMTEGIVPASVLVTHLLGEQTVTISLLGNEILLMVVGAGVALILNLYMPSIETELLKDKQAIEERMYQLFTFIADVLEGKQTNMNEKQLTRELELYLASGEKRAHRNANNYFFNLDSPYEKYFHMRNSQFQILHYMLIHLENLYMNVEQGYKVATFTRKVAESVKGKIIVEDLLEDLTILRDGFRESELPHSREEFENRAMLYQFLNDMEYFLDIKKAFKDKLTEKEREEYNRYYNLT